MANSKDYRNEIEKLSLINERYNSLKEEVEKISFLVRDKNDMLDLTEMNKWLIRVVNFYRDKGANINGYLFRNFYNSDVEDYQKRNNRINKYMEVLFKNMNYPGNYEFANAILGMKDISIENTENPMYDEMVNVVNVINQKYSDIINKMLEEIGIGFTDLGIDKEIFKFENINQLSKLIYEKQKAISFMTKRLEEEELNQMDNEKLDDDVNTVCEMVLLKREDSEEFNFKLSYMMELIARIRVFKELKSKYEEYSSKVNYDKLKEKIDKNKVENNTFIDNIGRLKKKLKEVEGKTFIFRNKNNIINDINGNISFLSKRINENNNTNKNRIKDYLLGFYDFCKLDKVSERIGINIGYDDEKLLGIFDFDKLSNIDLAISSVELFKHLGIKLPDINSQEFDKLSILCLNIVKKVKYSEDVKKR